MSAQAPASRPVHPCVLSITEASRGVELCTWAYITTRRRRRASNPTPKSTTGDGAGAGAGAEHDNDHDNHENNKVADFGLPNLVTACGSTLCVYSIMDESNNESNDNHNNGNLKNSRWNGSGSGRLEGRLRLEHTYSNICGTIVYLATLSSSSSSSSSQQEAAPDALILGFAGHPRLSVVTVTEQLLQAECLLDLSPALQDACFGAVSPLFEHDMIVCSSSSSSASSTSSSSNQNKGSATLACILGGGVAVAVVEIQLGGYGLGHGNGQGMGQEKTLSATRGWVAQEPFILQLSKLSTHLPYSNSNLNNNSNINHLNSAANSNLGQSMSTGFGDIISCTFLSGYLQPVLVLLHSEPGGRTFPGRLGRTTATSTTTTAAAAAVASGGAPPLYVTAISVGVAHQRAALLWYCVVTADAMFLSTSSSSESSSTTKSSPYLVVVGVNTIMVLDAGEGTVQSVLAVNGWARSTCPRTLQPLMQCNPLVKLSVSLDACALTWVSSSCAMVALRTGQLYVLQQQQNQQQQQDPLSTSSTNTTSAPLPCAWTLLPMGQSLGSIGEVEQMIALPFPSRENERPRRPQQQKASPSPSSLPSPSWLRDLLLMSKDNDSDDDDNNNNKKRNNVFTGLVFAASRLGNSHLLGYSLEEIKVPVTPPSKMDDEDIGDDDDENDKNSRESDMVMERESSSNKNSKKNLTTMTAVVDEEHERILRMEEDALYAPIPTSSSGNVQQPDVVPASSDEEDDMDDDDNNNNNFQNYGKHQQSLTSTTSRNKSNKNKRPRLSKFARIKGVVPLDCLVNLGPLGPSCVGPLSIPPKFLLEQIEELSSAAPGTIKMQEKMIYGAPAWVYPSGFGSSGGIALATCPGRDDRLILTEEDCFNVDTIFSLAHNGVVLLGMRSPPPTTTTTKAFGGGSKILRLRQSQQQQSSELKLEEVATAEWCGAGSSSSASLTLLQEMFGESSILLQAGEFSDGSILLLAKTETRGYVTLVVRESNKELKVVGDAVVSLRDDTIMDEGYGDDDSLVQVTPFVPHDKKHRDNSSNPNTDQYNRAPMLSFVGLWLSGKAQLYSFSVNGEFLTSTITIDDKSSENENNHDSRASDPIKMEVDENNNDLDEDDDVKEFYRDSRVVSVDLFQAPKYIFTKCREGRSVHSTMTSPRGRPSDEPNYDDAFLSYFDEDDEELYGTSAGTRSSSFPNGSARMDSHATAMRTTTDDDAGSSKRNGGDADEDEVLFACICKQSGNLEVYLVEENEAPVLCWRASGCGQGVLALEDILTAARCRHPRSHKVSAQEIRFFFCGPSTSSQQQQEQATSKKPPPSSLLNQSRSFCLAVEVSNGDFELYVARRQNPGVVTGTVFHKLPLKYVGRPSQEQARHRTKLIRRGIVERVKTADQRGNISRQFAYNRLSRFTGISGQDGLFSAGTRPLWIVAERGRPTLLFHRTRHAAPVGGKERPVSGFCSGLLLPPGSNTSGSSSAASASSCRGFLVLHERVGRVGSQRLTAFSGISTVFSSHGLLLGGLSGLCVEKIPMGVTVRRIEFINDNAASSGDHPLYAVLVSREIDLDQSSWNSDGLTPEERQKKQEEKEAAKIRKQVEADLGGFDIESEWVEEIEREDCFKVDTDLGGAPPLRDQAYSLWIVDASNKWMVVDSFELDAYEHGITMKVMHLSDFQEEPGSASAEISDEPLESHLFIAVGTGYVDHNGEDVTSKGRVLLFQIKRPQALDREIASSEVAELSLVYEKQIFHGPVSSLSCLSIESKNRLVIGAGADVNIEQWGNSKLTQVGFFRATMQILDLLLFKNFFLLSDAYDSLYFLVWRESDKSLTLLAKDYDPIPVYAAGLMSRGAAMTFVCHDDRQNLQFFQYAPGESAARGGNKLVCRADFHLGTQTTSFSSHFCRSSLVVHSATPTSTLTALRQQDPSTGRADEDQKIAAFFGSTDGGLGVVVPLSEPVYWRLIALQSVLANALDSDCALSCRAWRLYRRTPRRGGCRNNDRKKGVIDGNLILQYVHLPKSEQEDLASAIGSTVDLVLDNILEVQCGSMLL